MSRIKGIEVSTYYIKHLLEKRVYTIEQCRACYLIYKELEPPYISCNKCELCMEVE